MATIRLPRYYIGKPCGMQEIPAGVYDVDDPRLFGLASYLVENGHASVASIDVDFGSAFAFPAPIPSADSVAVNVTATNSDSFAVADEKPLTKAQQKAAAKAAKAEQG